MPSERTDQLHRLRTLHLFAGAGGGILSDVLLGHQPVCAVEINDYCQQVLSQRQADGMLPWFPIFDDVTTFDGKPWRGHVDVISGGFPCQDISVAGKGDGLDGERSGLWSEMARIIGEVQPRFAFVENSPMLTSRGLDRVLADLSTLGYDAEWGVVGADDAGAPHRRERIWILAHANGITSPERGDDSANAGQGGSRGLDPRGSGADDTRQLGTRTYASMGQHPIGQLAYPDMCGRLHGQAEVQPAGGGVHAQREPEPSGEDVANPNGQPIAGIAERGSERPEPYPTGTGWWTVEPGFCGVVNALAPQLDKT